MPKVPEYDLPNRASIDSHGSLYGAEYEHPLQGSHNHNVPCAVCHVSTRSAVLMIPVVRWLNEITVTGWIKAPTFA